MKFTQDVCSSSRKKKIKPLIVSNHRPWVPAPGKYQRSKSGGPSGRREKFPFCSVCDNPEFNMPCFDFEDVEDNNREEGEKSRRNEESKTWVEDFEASVETVKANSKQQRKRLKDLRTEYDKIESVYKSKIIEDLGEFYYGDDENMKRVRKGNTSANVQNNHKVNDRSVEGQSEIHISYNNVNAKKKPKKPEDNSTSDSSLQRSISITIGKPKGHLSIKVGEKQKPKSDKIKSHSRKAILPDDYIENDISKSKDEKSERLHSVNISEKQHDIKQRSGRKSQKGKSNKEENFIF